MRTTKVQDNAAKPRIEKPHKLLVVGGLTKIARTALDPGAQKPSDNPRLSESQDQQPCRAVAMQSTLVQLAQAGDWDILSLVLADSNHVSSVNETLAAAKRVQAGLTALMLACGDMRCPDLVIRQLLMYGADTSTRDLVGRTAVHHASMAGNAHALNSMR